MTLQASPSAPLGAEVAEWTTAAGVRTSHRVAETAGSTTVLQRLASALDVRRGMLRHESGTRVIGYVDPPLELTVRGDRFTATALSERGRLLLGVVREQVVGLLDRRVEDARSFSGRIPREPGDVEFAEEHRTRHAGVFSLLRAVLAAFAGPDDPLLGLHGAFGYDLIFQLDQIEPTHHRAADDRDIVLHLPDRLVEVDLAADVVRHHDYCFTVDGISSTGLDGSVPPGPPFRAAAVHQEREYPPGGYAAMIEPAWDGFRAGDLFEVVPTQAFSQPCRRTPSEIFARLQVGNPSSYSLLAALGEEEYLIGSSPEMFVRVSRRPAAGHSGLVIESAPISGTIARGDDALDDAEQIRRLLNSAKDESELTMCTDVDRNDKARVCAPGTVRVTGRRRTELYSTLIHTVDTVEGVLRDGQDALDAFLSHLWAVTVTGAPKLAAVEFIERHEQAPRRWYGGAVGRLGFDGTLDTTLTLRTVQVRAGVATVRAGASVIYASTAVDEERETELKARALLDAVADDRAPRRPVPSATTAVARSAGTGLSVLIVDHRDSFVHSLADYCRQTGADVVTYRSGRHLATIERLRPDLVLLSPGPGRPADFGVGATIDAAERAGAAVFGVCLGLQGLAEHLGADLGRLDHPMHGRPTTVRVLGDGGAVLAGLPTSFQVGRYHSLYARTGSIPPALAVTAMSEDGVVMAAEHRRRPLAGVQFHPESVMTARGGTGHRIIGNVMSWARRTAR
jgi:anthranilate synthase